MNVLPREVRILLGKELRQIRRSRGALASATLLPLFLITVMPLTQLFFALSATVAEPSTRSEVSLPPGMAEVANDQTQLLVSFMLPFFILLGGLVAPSISATYTVVAEREKRTLDLLIALPVSVTDILLGKLLAMLVLASVVVLPLFAIDMAVLVALGLTSVTDMLLLLITLLAALGCSVGVALLLALLARDFRTANNLNGAFLAPVIVATLAIMLLVTGPVRYLMLTVLLVGVGLLAVVAGLRWLTFERYLA
jgi:ABC-2 type transport system permease protein